MPQTYPEQATPVSAIILIVVAFLLFSMLDASAKWLVTSGMAAPFVTWCRFAGHAILAALMLRVWSRPAVYTVASWPMQIARACFLFGSTIFNFLALKTLQLGETVSIMFAGPMLITALAGPILGEWAGWRRWAAVIVGFIGVLIVMRPGFDSFKPAYVLSIAAVTCYALYVLLTRKLGTSETAESLIFMSALVPSILLLPAVPLYGAVPQSGLQWLLIAALGFFGAVGHWLLIQAYKQASATALAIYPYSQLVWMIFFGWLIFAQFPDGWTFAGLAVITASGLYILQRERMLRLRPSLPAQHEATDIARRL